VSSMAKKALDSLDGGKQAEATPSAAKEGAAAEGGADLQTLAKKALENLDSSKGGDTTAN